MSTIKAVGRFLHAVGARFLFVFVLCALIDVRHVAWVNALCAGALIETISRDGFPNFTTGKDAR